jgi:hypothetical protein
VVSYLRLTGKRFALLLIVLAAASATLTAYPSNYSTITAGLALYAIVLLALVAHCVKTASIKELSSILLLVVTSSTIGVLLGVLISQTLLSVLTATSICIFLLLYVLFATRWYR